MHVYLIFIFNLGQPQAEFFLCFRNSMTILKTIVREYSLTLLAEVALYG